MASAFFVPPFRPAFCLGRCCRPLMLLLKCFRVASFAVRLLCCIVSNVTWFMAPASVFFVPTCGRVFCLCRCCRPLLLMLTCFRAASFAVRLLQSVAFSVTWFTVSVFFVPPCGPAFCLGRCCRPLLLLLKCFWVTSFVFQCVVTKRNEHGFMFVLARFNIICRSDHCLALPVATYEQNADEDDDYD